MGFLDPAAPKKLMPRLNQLFNRAAVTQEEIHILRGIARGANGLRDADAGHDRVAILEENMRRREIPVKEATPVRRAQCVGYLIGEAEGVVDGERALAREPV